MEEGRQAAVYRFGDWLVEPELNRISRDGDELQLEAKTMDVLAYLIEHHEHVVSTDELLDHVWADRVVEPSTVHRRINQLRNALSDDSKEPTYIQTIVRRGYRAIAPVEPVEHTALIDAEDLARVTPPFVAYEGDEPYVFVCYAHDDKALVYPEITRLEDAGFNIWYDEGISPGSEWSDAIATHIERCAVFLYFVTPQSANTEHCRREVSFALGKSCRMLAVHLVPTEIPSGLELSLSNRQAILKYDEPRSEYDAKVAWAITDARSQNAGIATRDRHDAIAPRHRYVGWRTGVAVALLTTVGLGAWIINRPTTSSVPALDRSVAVTAFSIVGHDAETASYAEAVTQELRTDVAGYQEIRSVAVDDTTNVHDVSDASYVVGGNVQRRGAGVRVRASLTRIGDRQTIWAETFERSAADSRADPAQVAATIGRFIRYQLVQDHQCESVRRTARSVEAATAYCAAVAEAGRTQQGGDSDPRLVLSNAQHAIALDPGIADAYAHVAAAYSTLGTSGAMDWREAARHANEALAKGFAIAPNDPNLLSVRGLVQGQLELNYPAAEASHRASLQADPLQPGAQFNYLGLGFLATIRGDLQEAMQNARRALRIDDSSAVIYNLYAAVLQYAGENRESIKIADAGLDLVQSGPFRSYLLIYKARAHYALGETAAANAALDDALASVGPESKPTLAGVLASLDRTEEARQLLVKLEAIAHPPITAMVAAYAPLDHDRAFEWIHTAIDRHVWSVVLVLRTGAFLDDLRQDPRWGDVMTHLESQEAKGRAQRQGPN